LDVDRPIHLDRIEIWFNWLQGETQVAYSVLQDGREVGSGVLSRASCDPYQGAWCVATDRPGNDVQPGRYVVRLGRAGICQNDGSGGQGFIKAYGSRKNAGD
jgi:hypothetical protein